MTSKNTMQDFLTTAAAEMPSITCPACGNVMSLKKPSSYCMVLAENARIQLDLRLQDYANDIRRLESNLKILNVLGPNRIPEEVGKYPFSHRELARKTNLKEDGTYNGTGLFKAAVQLRIDGDIFEHKEFIFSGKFPLHSESAVRSAEQPEANDSLFTQNLEHDCSVFDVIVKGFEPASSAGPLLNLVLTQDITLDWMFKCSKMPNQSEVSTEGRLDRSDSSVQGVAQEEETAKGDAPLNKIDLIVQGVAPNLYQYLQDMNNQLEKTSNTQHKSDETAASAKTQPLDRRTISQTPSQVNASKTTGEAVYRKPSLEEFERGVKRI